MGLGRNPHPLIKNIINQLYNKNYGHENGGIYNDYLEIKDSDSMELGQHTVCCTIQWSDVACRGFSTERMGKSALQ